MTDEPIWDISKLDDIIDNFNKYISDIKQVTRREQFIYDTLSFIENEAFTVFKEKCYNDVSYISFLYMIFLIEGTRIKEVSDHITKDFNKQLLFRYMLKRLPKSEYQEIVKYKLSKDDKTNYKVLDLKECEKWKLTILTTYNQFIIRLLSFSHICNMNIKGELQEPIALFDKEFNINKDEVKK